MRTGSRKLQPSASRMVARIETMQDKSTLIHCEHVSNRSFDAAVAAFEAAVGITDDESFQAAVRASAAPTISSPACAPSKDQANSCASCR